MYSLPERRAGSPVHRSDGPRMAKSTPARCNSLAVATVTFLARSSDEPAQPTQNRYSWSKGPDPLLIGTPSGRAEAQSARSDCANAHGFSWFSMARSALPDSVGTFHS